MEITERLVARIAAPMSLGAVKQVSVLLGNRRDLGRRYLAEAPHGGVVVEVAPEVHEEDLVELRVAFADTQESFSVRGLVLWCRQAPGARRLAGVGFLSSEAEKRERMMALAAREDAPPPAGTDVERKDPRYAVTLKVTYETAAAPVQDYTRNISSGGLFVDSRQPPEVGSESLFRLFPPDAAPPIELPGRVVWRAPGRGFGVSFGDLPPEARAALARVVEQIAAPRAADERWPQGGELPA